MSRSSIRRTARTPAPRHRRAIRRAAFAVLGVAALGGAGVLGRGAAGDDARAAPAEPTVERVVAATPRVLHKTVEIDGLEIFYREAGDPANPTVLLLHGFPTSSHMFRDLIPRLAVEFHVVAPDYPGYGASSAPSVDEFEYSFANIASLMDAFVQRVGLDAYSLYLMDYGAPIGYRLAMMAPERVEGLIIQNGNAYVEGLREFWDPIRALWDDPSEANRDALRKLLTREATIWQYTHGTRNPEHVSPDNWLVDQPLLDRPGNQEVQLAMFYDYRTNVDAYPTWQRWFREAQPPAIILWGEHDHIFPAEGAHPYKRDLKNLEFHLLGTGHFALEEDGVLIAERIKRFLRREVAGR